MLVDGIASSPGTMRKLDYGINAFGIISAIAILGFLGEIAFFLAGYFLWFLNFFICMFSIAVLIFKGILKVISLFPSRPDAASLAEGSTRFLFYTFTNSIPTLAPFLMVYFDIALWSW